MQDYMAFIRVSSDLNKTLLGGVLVCKKSIIRF